MKRPLLRPLALVALAVCAAPAASAQEEPCRLERAVAPDYGGVMLGMTAGELARMFPGSDELQKALGAEAGAGSKPFVASLGMLELAIRREQFADAGELLLTFLGGRLHRIDVRYRQPVPWKGVAEFSEHASKRLALPADSWGAPASDAEKQSRVLDCRGFSVVVRIDHDGRSTLSIVDTAVSKEGGGGGAPPPPPAPAKRRTPKKRRGAAAQPPPAPGRTGKDEQIEKEGQ
jgi:hypothetical protein